MMEMTFRNWLYECVLNRLDENISQSLNYLFGESGDYVLPFGKYAGKPLSQIDRNYLQWSLDNLTSIRPDTRSAIQNYLQNKPSPAPTPARSTPMARPTPIQPDRGPKADHLIRLNVPFEEKDQAKSLGAVYDDGRRYNQGKAWFVLPGMFLQPFERWLPPGMKGDVQPANPYNPKSAEPQVVATNSWICGIVKGHNSLGMSLGSKIVARKATQEDIVNNGETSPNEEPWVVMSNDRNPHIIPRSQLPNYLTSVRGEDGSVMKVSDENEYLDPAPAAPRNRPEPVPSHERTIRQQRPSPEDVKIKPEHMTEYNKAIEHQFLNGIDQVTGKPSNIVINALAGTGKTTMLKHLSSFIKPGERWLYLVFNKRNQVESEFKFPAGVDVKTTHSYLADVLKKSGKDVGSLTTLPPQGKRIVRVREILDHVTPSDWPNTDLIYKDRKTGMWKSPFHNKAKRAVVAIVDKAKAYALNPADPGFQQNVMEMVNRLKIDTDVSTERVPADRDYTPDILEKVVEILKMTLPNALPNEGELAPLARMRDHDDTLWYAALYADQIRWNTTPKYDVILLDEVQDFNRCQLIMTQKLREAGARVIAVGDPHQCHPAGTKISLTGGGEINIEDIKVGTELVTYNSKKSYFPGVNTQGRKVEGIACRRYVGDMITVKTDSSSTEYTPNHRCLVRFNGDNKYCLYLMVKGNSARVGICRLNYLNGFGIGLRCRVERADKAWLLNIFETEHLARVAESVASAKYGLPQVIFFNNGQLKPTQQFIDEVYNGIGDNLSQAKKCVESFGRAWDFPVWEKGSHERHGKLKQNYIGSKKSFITQACNLISDYMQVRCYDGTNRGGKWETINVTRRPVDCNVYSLKVEPTEDGRRLYIANGQVTHNSMYLFRGADAQAFTELQPLLSPGSPEMSLPINFRSGGNIINFVRKNTHVKNLQAAPHKEGKGEVNLDHGYKDFMGLLQKEYSEGSGMLQHGTAIISRTNSPLTDTALSLMKAGVDFQIVGTDLFDEIETLVKKAIGAYGNPRAIEEKMRQIDLRTFQSELEAHVEKLQDQWGDKVSKADELKEVIKYTEALNGIISYLGEHNFQDPARPGRQINNLYTFMGFLESKLGGVNDDNADAMAGYKERDPRTFVSLMTAHKSKGLEFGRVCIIKPGDFSDSKPNIRTPEEAQQERNCWYVGLTRGMDSLFVANDEEP